MVASHLENLELLSSIMTISAFKLMGTIALLACGNMLRCQRSFCARMDHLFAILLLNNEKA